VRPLGYPLGAGSKLPQEAHVVLAKEAEVIDLVKEHGNALNAHTKGIARVLVGVDTAVLQHFGMHHAAAQYLYPTGMLTHSATFTTTDKAAYIHFGTGLGEGEVRGAKANFHIFSKELLHKEVERLLQVGKGHVLVNIKAFNLMEKAVGAG